MLLVIMEYRLMKLDAKFHAIEDCLNAMRTNEDINIIDMMKQIRKLSKKQFKILLKKGKLVNYM